MGTRASTPATIAGVDARAPMQTTGKDVSYLYDQERNGR